MRIALIAALALLLAPAAPAQGGYTKEQHADIGITLPRARDYEQIPTQPDEEQLVLYYAEKLPKDKRDARSVRPELQVVWIDWTPDPPPPADKGSEAPPIGGAPLEDPPVEPPPINTLERFVEQRTLWQLGRSVPGKDEGAFKATLYTLAPKPNSSLRGAGWCYAFAQAGKRTIAFIGTCADQDLEEQSKIWRYIAEHSEFYEPEGADLAKLRVKYARSALRDIEYRLQVRAKLVRGWKAEDTENFIVVYHTPDQVLIRTLVSDLESIRTKYVELFPAVGAITAVSTARVCRDQAEYLAYGGMPGSAGYWNSDTQELVFYDATIKQKGKRERGAENTFIVLYHEAFHQYIHYSAGELPPHSWFNEGHGDYFSGADIRGTKVKSIGVNSWRIATIQRAIEERKFVPWKEILEFEQPEYYRRDRVHICYAQGWSMIYFLRTAKVALQHPQWSKILSTYFDALKQDYGRRLKTLGAEGAQIPERAKEEAGVEARKYALARAFAGVDIAALESAWREFTEKLEYKP